MSIWKKYDKKYKYMKYENKIARPPADGIGFIWIFLSFGLSINNLYLVKINSKKKFNSYTQVFDLKHGFISNLSIIDLLFNLGPNTLSHLKID